MGNFSSFFSGSEEAGQQPTQHNPSAEDVELNLLNELAAGAVKANNEEEIAKEIDLEVYGNVSEDYNCSDWLCSILKMFFSAICTAVLIFCFCFACIDWMFRLSQTFDDDFDHYSDYFDEDFLIDFGLSSAVIATCLGALFGHEFVLIHLLDYGDTKYQKLDNNCCCCCCDLCEKCKCCKKVKKHDQGVGLFYLLLCCCICSKCKFRNINCDHWWCNKLYSSKSCDCDCCGNCCINHCKCLIGCGMCCGWLCEGSLQFFICDLFNPQVTISFLILWFLIFGSVSFGLYILSNCIAVYKYIALILVVVLFFLLPQIGVSIRDYRIENRKKNIQNKQGELLAMVNEQNLRVTHGARGSGGRGGGIVSLNPNRNRNHNRGSSAPNFNPNHQTAVSSVRLSTCGKISIALQIALGVVGFLIGGLRMKIGFEETIDSCSNNSTTNAFISSVVSPLSVVNLNINDTNDTFDTYNTTEFNWEVAMNMTNVTWDTDNNITNTNGGLTPDTTITTTTAAGGGGVAVANTLTQLEEAFGGYRTALFGILAMVSCVEVIYEAQKDFKDDICIVLFLTLLLWVALATTYFVPNAFAAFAAAIPLAFIFLDKVCDIGKRFGKDDQATVNAHGDLQLTVNQHSHQPDNVNNNNLSHQQNDNDDDNDI